MDMSPKYKCSVCGGYVSPVTVAVRRVSDMNSVDDIELFNGNCSKDGYQEVYPE